MGFQKLLDGYLKTAPVAALTVSDQLQQRSHWQPVALSSDICFETQGSEDHGNTHCLVRGYSDQLFLQLHHG